METNPHAHQNHHQVSHQIHNANDTVVHTHNAKKSGGKKKLITVLLLLIAVVVVILLTKKTPGAGVFNSSGVDVGDKVSIKYSAKFDDGTSFGPASSENEMVFVVGNKEVVKGIEEAVMGMKKSQQKLFTLTPDKGYGVNYDPGKVQKLPYLVFQNIGVEAETGKYYVIGNLKGFIKSIIDEEGKKLVVIDTNSLETTKDIEYDIVVEDIEKPVKK